MFLKDILNIIFLSLAILTFIILTCYCFIQLKLDKRQGAKTTYAVLIGMYALNTISISVILFRYIESIKVG